MTARLDRLARFSIRHHRLVVALWVAVAVAVSLLAGGVGKQFADNLTLPGKDSQEATDLVAAHFPDQVNGTNPVLFKTKQGKVTSGEARQAIDQTVKRLEGESGVAGVASPFSQAGQAQISRDGRIAYISVTLADANGELSDTDADRLVDAATRDQSSKVEVAVGGYLGQQVSKPATESSEAVGLAVAAVVLLLTFGSVVAMGLPLLTALIGLVIGMGLIGLLSHATTISTTAPTLATMIGLGVGIDYALFIVTRHKTGMAGGLEPDESAARATATAGGAVLFAGMTVVVALLALGLAGIPLVWTLGYSAAVAVVLAILAALTFLPAVLGWIGHGIDRLRIPSRRTKQDEHARGWIRWAEGVANHPWPAVIVAVLILVILAWPVTDLRLGQKDLGDMPADTQTRKAYDLNTEGFGVGQNGPFLVASKLNGDRNAASSLARSISKDRDVASVSPPRISKDGEAAIFNAVPKSSPSSFTTEDAVDRVRTTTIPEALGDSRAEAHLGGVTAGYVDLAESISASLPWLILIVVALSLFLLLLAFRSIVIPLQAAAMNLISIAAAYGVVTAVFQKGWGASLIGLEGPTPVVSFLPLVMFAILFGLSMDYEVFLMSQIREIHARSGKNRHAVIHGLASSARVITAAAAIMVAVFASFVLNGDPVVKQFGVGLAFAVLIDATVVRCFLVPALLVVFERWNWWLPGWLDRFLPRVDIEGNSFYENRP
ncbi:MAG: MMPL family transporter [Solirubrobacterales bacterium]|nr:MMPL family transporter [Solirubrobacterales bacterium]